MSAMIVDGKAIAARLYDAAAKEIAALAKPPRLGILTCAPNFETERYLQLKQKKATEIGIATSVATLPENTTTEEMLAALEELISRTDGVVVQLPLPAHIDVEKVITTVPPTHDVDALNPLTTSVLSPVVGAIKEILAQHSINPEKKHVAIVGSGKLVGLPAYKWFTEQGAHMSVVTKDTEDISFYTRPADIIVLGAGVPNLITPDMVKDGVVILDAGTSEEGGMLKGDTDPQVADKASVFTPVPGGIGPITIAVLLRNVVELAQNKN